MHELAVFFKVIFTDLFGEFFELRRALNVQRVVTLFFGDNQQFVELRPKRLRVHPRVRERRVAHRRERFFGEQVMRIFVDGGINHFVVGFKIFIVQNNFMRIGFV